MHITKTIIWGGYLELQFSGKEVFFDRDDLIVSKTDPQGRLTYVNHTFLDIAESRHHGE